MTNHVEEYLKELEMGCRHKHDCQYKEDCTPPPNLDNCGIYTNWASF